MPHIIIEYSSDCICSDIAASMVDAAYVSVQETELFATKNIKVRAIPVDIYRLGSAQTGYVHVQCRIHSGRTAEQSRRLS